MSGMVVIYGLADPRDGQLRYVGRTTRTLRTRLHEHLATARYYRRSGKREQYVFRWINDALTAGVRPEIFEIETSSTEEWAEAEQFWIGYFRFIGCALTNATPGGEGIDGFRFSPDQIESMRQQRAKQWRDPERRKRQREIAVKQWASEDARERKSREVRASMTPERRRQISEHRKRQWQEDDQYRANVVAAQQFVDRSTIAKEFWKRPEYQARQEDARARRKARGWSSPKP